MTTFHKKQSMNPRDPSSELADHQFEIAVCQLADDLRYGQDASRYVGHGIDYVQTRGFVDGDAVRDIDWRVTARTGKYYVKEYERLQCTPIYLIVDTSASMAYSSQPKSKHSLATWIAGGLGLAALGRLSPVGLLSGGDRGLHFQPTLSRANIFQWMWQLRHKRYDEQTRLAERIDEISSAVQSRHLMVVISDLHDPDSASAIGRLAQRHDCVVLQLEDPAERGNLLGGIFRGVEAETGRTFTGRSRSRWFEKRPVRVDQQLTSAGIDHLLLPTDVPIVAPLRRFLAARGGLVRNSR